MSGLFRYLSVATLLTTGLSACVSTEDQARYETMSCYELAKEIGRHEANKSRAEDDGFAASLDGLFADNKKERNRADVDELFADIDENTAKEHLGKLRRLARQKRCQ